MYEVRCIVSIVIDDVRDSSFAERFLSDVVLPPTKLSPPTLTENGDPLTFFPLYLTVTKYLPGTIGVYRTS